MEKEGEVLLVRYEGRLPADKLKVLKNLVGAGIVKTDEDLKLAVHVMRAYKVPASSLVRWANQGIDLSTTAKVLAVREYLRMNMSAGFNLDSVVALNGYLEKLGSGLQIAYIVDPATGLVEVGQIPEEVIAMLEVLLGVVVTLPGTKFPLQRMLFIVNNHYGGNIRKAVEEATSNPLTLRRRVLGECDAISAAYDRVGEFTSDEGERAYHDPEAALRDFLKGVQ